MVQDRRNLIMGDGAYAWRQVADRGALAYTLVADDENSLVTKSGSTARVVTIPPQVDVDLPVGTRIGVLQLGTGQITITAGAGVTINNRAGFSGLINRQYGMVVLTKYLTNTWLLEGQLLDDVGAVTASSGAATLAKLNGVVTSEALTTAAAAAYTLTLTNSLIAAGDIVLASVDNVSNSQGIPIVGLITPSASQVIIKVYNLHASQALNGTIKISYRVLKAA